jgi:hypothetical protein
MESTMPPGSRAAYNEVSTVLWRERDLLDGLAFRLEMQALVLMPGRDRWLLRACREIEISLSALRSAERIRVEHVENLAKELGLGPSPSLRMIISAVAEPWKEIFGGHRDAFLEVTGEVRRLAAHNRRRLGETRERVSDPILWIDDDRLGPADHSSPRLDGRR